jgi:hypothetical protein
MSDTDENSLQLKLDDMIFIDDDYAEIINNNDDFKRLEGYYIIDDIMKDIKLQFILMKYPTNNGEEEIYSISLINEKNIDNYISNKILTLEEEDKQYIYYSHKDIFYNLNSIKNKIDYFKKLDRPLHFTLIIFKKLIIDSNIISIAYKDIINIFYMTSFDNDLNKYSNDMIIKNFKDFDYRINFHIKHRSNICKIFFKEELKKKLKDKLKN